MLSKKDDGKHRQCYLQYCIKIGSLITVTSREQCFSPRTVYYDKITNVWRSLKHKFTNFKDCNLPNCVVFH